MAAMLKNLLEYRELIGTLARKNVVVPYKQAYPGLPWTIAKALIIVLIFALMREFIDSGGMSYSVLTYCALMQWTFFQESPSEGVNSAVE